MTDRTPYIEGHAKGVSVKYRRPYARAAAGEATPMQAIRAKCLDCSCYQHREIANCGVYACPLWAYRPGSGMKRRRAINPPNKGVRGAQD